MNICISYTSLTSSKFLAYLNFTYMKSLFQTKKYLVVFYGYIIFPKDIQYLLKRFS